MVETMQTNESGSGMTVIDRAPVASSARRETPAVPTRERILRAGYDLFAQRGIRDVAIDEIIALSGVAKATLYRHFPSKDDLYWRSSSVASSSGRSARFWPVPARVRRTPKSSCSPSSTSSTSGFTATTSRPAPL